MSDVNSTLVEINHDIKTDFFKLNLACMHVSITCACSSIIITLKTCHNIQVTTPIHLQAGSAATSFTRLLILQPTWLPEVAGTSACQAHQHTGLQQLFIQRLELITAACVQWRHEHNSRAIWIEWAHYSRLMILVVATSVQTPHDGSQPLFVWRCNDRQSC